MTEPERMELRGRIDVAKRLVVRKTRRNWETPAHEPPSFPCGEHVPLLNVHATGDIKRRHGVSGIDPLTIRQYEQMPELHV